MVTATKEGRKSVLEYKLNLLSSFSIDYIASRVLFLSHQEVFVYDNDAHGAVINLESSTCLPVSGLGTQVQCMSKDPKSNEGGYLTCDQTHDTGC